MHSTSPKNETDTSEIKKRNNIIYLFWTTACRFITLDCKKNVSSCMQELLSLGGKLKKKKKSQSLGQAGRRLSQQGEMQLPQVHYK